METLIRIPRAFFIDHMERDLPTPKIIRETKRDFHIKRDDPAMGELTNDARHYADPKAHDAPRSLVRAAQALIDALSQNRRGQDDARGY